MSNTPPTIVDIEKNPGSDENFDPKAAPKRQMTKMRETLKASVSSDSHDDEIRTWLNKMQDKCYIYTEIASVIMGNLWVGYYWILYNELYYHIKAPYGLDQWPDYTSLIQGGINALFFSGAIVGSILTKFLGDRKYSSTFIIMDILGVVSVFLSFVPNMWVLFGTRFLQGIQSGLNFILSAGYMRELSPKSLLSTFSTLSTACLIGGFILGTSIFLPYAFHVEFANYWCLCLAFGAIFPAIRLVCGICSNNETPAYWLKQGEKDKARDIFNDIYPVANLERAGLTWDEHEEAIEWLILREQKLLKDAEPSTNPTEEKSSCGGYKSAMIGVYVWFFNQFTGLQGINSYSSAVFRTFTSDETATLITITLTFAGFLAAVLAAFYVNMSRRKLLLVGGGAACAISLAITAVFTWMDWVIMIVVMNIIFRLSYGLLLSAGTWPYINETCSSKNLFIPFLSQWVFVFLISLVYPMIVSVVGAAWIFMGCAVITGVNCVVCWIVLKESRGLTREELAVLYDGPQNSGLESELEKMPAEEAVTDVEDSSATKLQAKIII